MLYVYATRFDTIENFEKFLVCPDLHSILRILTPRTACMTMYNRAGQASLVVVCDRQQNALRACLVCPVKFYRSSHRIFGYMHGVLNIDYL